jgi:conjugative transfer signal peptidase TraF
MIVLSPLVGMLLGIVLLVAPACAKPVLRLVYNASDSAPRGWYTVNRPEHLDVGDYVVVRLPGDVATFAALRGYLPLSVPVLKRIAALSGQHVCIHDATVYIDGVAAARVLDADHRQRPLTAWQHCRLLIKDELFLLNAAAPESFDSRYFGPVDMSFVRGRATPLTTAQQR